jgi:hypothetical protein
MIVRPDMRQFRLLDILIEFKYVSLSDAGLTGEKVQKESVELLQAIPSVKEKFFEAATSLARYRDVLIKKYDNGERLRCFSVAALGFERLVWEEQKGEVN